MKIIELVNNSTIAASSLLGTAS